MRETVAVIDIFAGPGGLGEGFASFRRVGRVHHPYKVRLSVEMDEHAHRTLELRSFFRQFCTMPVPDDYYAYLQGKLSRAELFERWPKQAARARREALRATLGSADNQRIYARIRSILAQHGRRPWVLIGGPPCQCYSTIGRGRRQAAGAGRTAFERDHRHFLYREYLSILARFRPPVFIMENVKGILSSRVGNENIFRCILADLRHPSRALSEFDAARTAGGDACGYPTYRVFSLAAQGEEPENLDPLDFVVQAEDYGIPQARHRVILMGVRDDLRVRPSTLERNKELVAAESVLADLPAVRSMLSREQDSAERWRAVVTCARSQPWFQDAEVHTSGLEKRTPWVRAELCHAVDSVPSDLSPGGEFIPGYTEPAMLRDWIVDRRVGGVCNHSARAHMNEDLHRYFFCACFARVCGQSPRMADFPEALLPAHQNVRQAIDGDIFDDRFRVQEADKPAVTITCHMAKDGHYNIHYDPTQCRSLTVREAARLQTFPDNYLFEGSRTQQYRQVGNAVPPLLAIHIARVVYDVLEQAHAADR